VSPGPDDVPSKGDSQAARRLRDQKALLIGPGKPPGHDSAHYELVRREMQLIQKQQQELEKQRKALESRYKEALEAFRQSQGGGEARNVQPREFQQLIDMDVQRAMLQQQQQQLEANAARLAAAQQQQAQRAAMPDDATTRVYTIRYSRAPEIAQVLSQVLSGKALRLAVDERTNSLIVFADKDTSNVVEALVMKLDRSAGETEQSQPGQTLQLRIVWLLDGDVGMPPTAHVSSEVVDALHELGFKDPEVVCQQVATFTVGDDNQSGEFQFLVPALINSQPWQLEGHGEIRPAVRERFNVRFDLHFRQTNPRQHPGMPAENAPGQKGQLGGSILTPLGHYTVLGTTTVLATDTAADPATAASNGEARQQQHLAAFVVYLDAAREFPASRAPTNNPTDVRR
jgi:hypothetical protein